MLNLETFKHNVLRIQNRLIVPTNTFGLDKTNVVGFLTTNTNYVNGWTLHTLTTEEMNEFGLEHSEKKFYFRTYSENTDTTNIIKMNPLSGSYSFMKLDVYSETNKVKFERVSKYRSIHLVK